ncbi:MAG: aspartate aminotransferase family protein [Anaerolineae bacterium]|nr:aspartate aminotransferase family protein [Anaerolineae bacterium]
MQQILKNTAERASRYLESLETRSVFPTSDALNRLAALDTPMPDHPESPEKTLAALDEYASPATVGMAGSRYFGFVIGGSLPAALAANWLAGAWDQNAGLYVASPAASILEDVAGRWLLDVLGLPEDAGVGFVTGATMANFTGLAAARHKVLADQGWNVEADGMFGAPPITIIVGDEVHISLLKALSLLGFGSQRVTRVPVDSQGRMRADAFPEITGPTIVCLQAGNVNTGASDPLADLIPRAHAAGAWVHVDGAFGLWANAAPDRMALVQGIAGADSWATDGHKWLNVPYDSGLVFVRDPEMLRAAMNYNAAYLVRSESRDPFQYTPELSRRARGIEIWAAMRSLGRSGIADLVERCCRHAARFAEGLSAAGCRILNDVDLNQVLVSFGDAETTRQVIAAVQQEGTCWAGGTVWQGHTAMRISVSSWATTAEDVEQSLEAIINIANSITHP